MMIKFKQQKSIEVMKDINFPYYYEDDVSGDDYESIIYGIIYEDGKTISIHESYYFRSNNTSYEIKMKFASFDYVSCYFRDEYKSCDKEFEKVKERMFDFFEKEGLVK